MLPDLEVQILHTGNNAKWLHHIYAGDPHVKLTMLPEPYYSGGFDRDTYSAALTDVRMWWHVSYARALQFQKDTWLCAGEGDEAMLPRLHKFLPYALVAAPWDWPETLRVSAWAKSKPTTKWLRELEGCHGVGNGGFRFLNISAMRHATNIHGPINTSRHHGKLVDTRPEDIYFCQHLGKLPGVNVANESVARSFGVEALAPTGTPIGTHRPWKHRNVWNNKGFRAACPGLELLRLAQAGPSTCSSHALGELEALGDELVQWASTRYNATRKMAALDGVQRACSARSNDGGCPSKIKALADKIRSSESWWTRLQWPFG